MTFCHDFYYIYIYKIYIFRLEASEIKKGGANNPNLRTKSINVTRETYKKVLCIFVLKRSILNWVETTYDKYMRPGLCADTYTCIYDSRERGAGANPGGQLAQRPTYNDAVKAAR